MNTSKPSILRLVTVGAAGAVAGALVNAAIYSVGRAADVAYIVTRTTNGPKLIHFGDVVSFSLMTFAVGLLAAVVATRVGRPSLRGLQILGSVVAIASTSMDFFIDSTVAAKASLAVMHIVVGVAYAATLRAVRSVRANPATDTPALEPALRLAAA